MLPQITRVFLACHRVDFRKQLNGLLAEAYALGADPYKGDCVVFVKGDQTQLRAITGDSKGLFLVCRRFDNDRLRQWVSFATQPSTQSISAAELSLMLEGSTFTIHRRVRPWRTDDGLLESRS